MRRWPWSDDRIKGTDVWTASRHWCCWKMWKWTWRGNDVMQRVWGNKAQGWTYGWAGCEQEPDCRLTDVIWPLVVIHEAAVQGEGGRVLFGWRRSEQVSFGSRRTEGITEPREKKKSWDLHLNYCGFVLQVSISSPENEELSENRRVFPGCSARSATSLISWLWVNLLHGESRGFMIDVCMLWK